MLTQEKKLPEQENEQNLHLVYSSVSIHPHLSYTVTGWGPLPPRRQLETSLRMEKPATVP